MGDAGSYTCTVSSFPGGTLEGTTELVVDVVVVVKDGVHKSAKIITAGVFFLIVGTMLTTTFFIIRKRYVPVPSD
ncbi:hypothetical protein PBY51_017288 [Eleginops maclovinus]|uniref:Uncharacterized protein n=1 Tax=Eleginops maclovinus TaxID=56733 RepID=A0AAN7XK57_ELEMC|nr:hypothetical protein PBY51_017288 [Eleginops maclovinus]